MGLPIRRLVAASWGRTIAWLRRLVGVRAIPSVLTCVLASVLAAVGLAATVRGLAVRRLVALATSRRWGAIRLLALRLVALVLGALVVRRALLLLLVLTRLRRGRRMRGRGRAGARRVVCRGFAARVSIASTSTRIAVILALERNCQHTSVSLLPRSEHHTLPWDSLPPNMWATPPKTAPARPPWCWPWPVFCPPW